MKKISVFLQKIELVVGCISLLLIFAEIALNVVMRYIFNNPIALTDEWCSLIYVWAGLLSCAYNLGNDSHVRMTALEDRFSEPARQGIRLVMDILVGIVFIFLVYRSFPVIKIISTKTHSFKVSYKKLYLIMPIFFALSAIHSFSNIYLRLEQLKQYRLEQKGEIR